MCELGTSLPMISLLAIMGKTGFTLVSVAGDNAVLHTAFVFIFSYVNLVTNKFIFLYVNILLRINVNVN